MKEGPLEKRKRPTIEKIRKDIKKVGGPVKGFDARIFAEAIEEIGEEKAFERLAELEIKRYELSKKLKKPKITQKERAALEQKISEIRQKIEILDNKYPESGLKQ